MTTTTIQQTPAQRLAQKIRARTNDTRDILDLLHQIAQGEHDATEHDRLTATGILFDRGYGKCPKQPITLSEAEPSRRADETTEPQTANRPESPRLVTQLDDSLHDSLGPAPEAESAEAGGGGEPALSLPKGRSRESGNPESYDISHSNVPENPDPFDDTSSIQSTIRDHIISITNDGDTLIDVLIEVAWPDDSLEPSRKVKPFHRNRAGKMLLDRAAGRDLTPILTAIQKRPEPVLSDEDYPDYPPGYVFDPTKGCIYCSQSLDMPEGHEGEHRFDHEGLAKAFEEVERMLEEQGITPDPNPPKIDYPMSGPSKEWEANNIDVIREVAAKFREENRLRIERQKAWPAIEERRRKKLEQIYPSHSNDEDHDGDPPET